MDYNSLLDKVVELSEDGLRHLVQNFFVRQGCLADYTHGTEEHGADVIITLKQRDDILGIGQVIFIQVKAKDINLPTWREEKIYGQLLELATRPPMLLNTDKIMSRRIVFIASGKINQGVVDSIHNFNEKNPVPIEALDGKRLAKLLSEKGYKPEYFDEDVKARDIARPIQNIGQKPVQQVLGTKSGPTIHAKRLGHGKGIIKSKIVG